MEKDQILNSELVLNQFIFQYVVHSDQFPGHPDGVNALIPITDNVVITGCEDGNVRAVHLYPHRFVYFLFATMMRN